MAILEEKRVRRKRKDARDSKGRKPCAFPECGNLNFARGFCSGHTKQIRCGRALEPLRQPRPEPAPGFHWCSRCKQFRDELDFGWDTVRSQLKRICLECCSASQAEYVAKNRERVNLAVRLRKRGLTVDEFQAMLLAQDHKCKICNRERPLDIDHCHETGRVRGLLCGPCNRAIGFVDDDPEILRSALRYLELKEA